MRREANRLRGRGARGMAGRGVYGAQARRAGDARCGGALARIRVWGLGAARLLYELILCGFAWSKIPHLYGILFLSGRHFL